LIALQYLQIGRVVNRVRFVEKLLHELTNVFIYYKTQTIHLDNIVARLFSEKNYQFASSGQMFAVATPRYHRCNEGAKARLTRKAIPEFACSP